MQSNLAIWHFYYSLSPFYIASVRININIIFTTFFPLLIRLQNKLIQLIPVFLPHRHVPVKHSSKLSIVIFRHDVS